MICKNCHKEIVFTYSYSGRPSWVHLDNILLKTIFCYGGGGSNKVAEPNEPDGMLGVVDIEELTK